jgi:integrase
VALYLTWRAEGHTVATIEQDLSAISAAHRAAGLDTPRSAAVVREVRSGIRRRLGVAPKVKAPLLAEDLEKVVAALPATLAGIRDRALLLVGFAAALRRSELVGLEVGDLEWTEEGLKLRIRRSKTDQEGLGRPIGVPHGKEACPVQALKAWLEAARITEGPVFREVTRHGRVGDKALSGRSIARVVQASALAAGLEASSDAGHSLRAGLATSAARGGKSERSIMNQTGHRSSAMVRRYIRDAELFRDNAAEGLL